MQKKIANILFSTRLTGILFIVFAVAMAAGTLLDRNMETSPTPFTRHYIYNAWWFEAIMVFFLINFFGNIGRYRLWRKEKWATLILHLSWILIIVGAGVTRYIGYEGAMRIDEGATESSMLSLKTYLKGRIVGDFKVNNQLVQRNFEAEVDFSERLDNDFSETYTYGDTPVTIEVKEFIAGAEKAIIPNENGDSYLKIVEAGNGKPHNHFLKDGEIQNIHNVLFTLNKFQEGAINISNTEDGLFIQSPYEGEYLTMATMTQGKLVKDSLQPLALRSRYIIENMQIVFPDPVVKGEFSIAKKSKILKNDEDGVILNVSANGETKEVGLLGGQGSYNGYEDVTVGGLDISIQYGSKVIDLPFSIKLNDFISEKYPGAPNVPKSFESKVTVIDDEVEDFDYRIYMNHVLDHKGYRFFQSGYEPDEKTTILSVNHDMWGTYLTYAGYILLYIGLMAIMFSKNTRFDDLRKQLDRLKKKKSKLLTIFILCFGLVGFSQEHSANDGHDHNQAQNLQPTKQQLDSILKANIVPKEHADKFAKMVIQDASGRMMPMHTFASEVLRKLSKKDTYEGLSAPQILLSMQESNRLWYNMPIIYLTPRKADTVRSIIGVNTSEKYVSLLDFINPNGTNKLDPYLEEAFSASIPNGSQKEIKMAYERLNLLSGIIEGRYMKIFPIPDNEINKWISSFEYKKGDYKDVINEKDSLYGNFVKNGFSFYLMTLNNAKKTGDFSNAEKVLNNFKETQQKFGSEVMLSDEKIQTEIAYNKYDIFKKLFSWYMYASTLLFIFIIWQILKFRSKVLEVLTKIFIGIIIFLFALHTGGLITRWYLSGHAPWSDAYESMIYVAWATMLFGLLFGRKSKLTIASSAFVVSIILMIAHWNWMDPAIGNLQPVLQGYWLMIHVSVIVASYGPFAIGMILGLVALLLMILTNKNNKERMKINVKEITIINELALTVGLVMLTIGNFLGGMWANESWGRYWGWDPKETWALISIMFYAFVIHMRLIPGLRGKWLYNLLSVLTFGSILMTYFGVNFYLSGLHAYASGDQIISFQFIAIALAIIGVIAFFAFRKYKTHYK
ncbi:cytochrome c biogenesis protein CcsA [Winogradskyella litorisediminis]|uniref:Cytochrome c biogenesis protein CcsA n=1 Tax=Winogradskyella litorisediminis TaxID=1156618 RepID=A0ABW3ND75_9FLAO